MIPVRRRYLEELWFLMHHSNDPNRQSVVLNCYVDDSNSHEQTDVVVLGGFFMNRERFVRFDKKWQSMLHRYRICSLHMKDFVRPTGQHIGMHHELKLALFTEAAGIINTQKATSVSIAVKQPEFMASIPQEVHRKGFSPYTVAFLHLARYAGHSAHVNNSPDWISYLVDQGSNAAPMIQLGHALIQGWEKRNWPSIRTGSLTFDSDDNVSALQAADVIAWSFQRKLAGKLIEEFSPLNEIFCERFNANGNPARSHWIVPVKDDSAAAVAAMVRNAGPEMERKALANLQALWGEPEG